VSSSSTAANYRYARKWRDAMIRALGGRCAWCKRTDRLELDHIDGRTWSPRALSWHRRIKRYREEHARGRLQVLCRSCNAIKGGRVEQPARRYAAAVIVGDFETEPDWVREGEPRWCGP
jgi:5-methylcytosine-specific restriction endonuclease McrA